ncbi:ABC transporter permease [Spirillospora sp. NPDC052269]
MTSTTRSGAATLVTVIAAAPRPARPSALTAARVFAWRSLLKIRHVPEQLSDVLAVPVIFTLMFTYLFGGALAGSPHHYLQFLLPGTLVMAVLLATICTGVNLNADFGKGVYDRFRTLPMWPPAPIVGALLGDVLRYLLASVLIVALGLTLGYRPHGGPAGVALGVALVVAFSTALSWVFTWLGLILRTANAVTSLAFLVLFPLTMASNTFRRPPDHAGLAPRPRQRQPGDAPGHRCPRHHERPPAPRADHRRGGRGGPHHGDLRSADHARLPRQELNRAATIIPDPDPDPECGSPEIGAENEKQVKRSA